MSPIPQRDHKYVPFIYNEGTRKQRRLIVRPPGCIIYYTMTNSRTISETLRALINASELSFLALERETGVIRQSLMPFARGESGINIHAADKLAAYFGLELRPATQKTATRSTPKRKGK